MVSSCMLVGGCKVRFLDAQTLLYFGQLSVEILFESRIMAFSFAAVCDASYSIVMKELVLAAQTQKFLLLPLGLLVAWIKISMTKFCTLFCLLKRVFLCVSNINIRQNDNNKKLKSSSSLSHKWVSYLVTSCFEPIQPLGVTSGLNTNSNLSLIYSAHTSFNINHIIFSKQLF